MARLLRDIMGLRVEFERPTTTELSLSSGERVQVFAPGDPYFAFFSEQASGPSPCSKSTTSTSRTASSSRRGSK